MIHILTVHYNSTFWIAPQIDYIKRYTYNQYRIYAFLNKIDQSEIGSYADDFYYVSDQNILDHATKLNLLADMACFAAESEDDILVFIDSDAFPIAPWENNLMTILKTFPLAAVRRDENAGDYQPHPCFCVTTVKFWKSIKGDWRAGHKWKNLQGKLVTDVGGNLLKKLSEMNISWYPLLRTNKINAHPVFFGIYGSKIYHHGAGSRKPSCRQDRAEIFGKNTSLFKNIFQYLGIKKFLLKKRMKKNGKLSENIKLEIEKNKNFFEMFL